MLDKTNWVLIEKITVQQLHWQDRIIEVTHCGSPVISVISCHDAGWWWYADNHHDSSTLN